MTERRPNHTAENELSADGSNRPQKLKQRTGDGHLKSRVVKRSLVVGGHKTSVSLEDVFWNELRAIAHRRRLHLSQLVGTIDSERQHGNLSSAIRLFVFEQSCNHSAADNRQDRPDETNPDGKDARVLRSV
jgi:predicted DNA-binding ribbon-helix-helix protein